MNNWCEALDQIAAQRRRPSLEEKILSGSLGAILNGPHVDLMRQVMQITENTRRIGLAVRSGPFDQMVARLHAQASRLDPELVRRMFGFPPRE